MITVPKASRRKKKRETLRADVLSRRPLSRRSRQRRTRQGRILWCPQKKRSKQSNKQDNYSQEADRTKRSPITIVEFAAPRAPMRALAEDRPGSGSASCVVPLFFPSHVSLKHCRLETMQRYTSRLSVIALQQGAIDEFRCTGKLRAVEKLFSRVHAPFMGNHDRASRSDSLLIECNITRQNNPTHLYEV